jgi:hypothetical protein
MNPRATAAHTIFSGGIGKESREEVERRVAANIEAAPDMQHAMQAAMPGLQFQSYSHHPVWPKWLADALRKRARDLDMLNARLMEVARPRGYGNKDNPIHPGLYKQAVPYGLNDVTVEKFLDMAGQRQ